MEEGPQVRLVGPACDTEDTAVEHLDQGRFESRIAGSSTCKSRSQRSMRFRPDRQSDAGRIIVTLYVLPWRSCSYTELPTVSRGWLRPGTVPG